MTLPIPDLNLSGPYFNSDGSPNAAGIQLLRVINAVKARTGGMVSDGVSEASATATGGATQTLAEWFADVEAATSGLAAHLADTTDAHDASAISYVGGTGMSATDVEAAIDELATEKANAAVTLTAGLGISGGGDLSANRSFAFDPSELTDVATVSGDGLVFMDVSDSNAPKRRTISSFFTDLGVALLAAANAFTDTLTVTKTSAGAATNAIILRNASTNAGTETVLQFNPSAASTRYSEIVARNDGANNTKIILRPGAGGSLVDALTLDLVNGATMGVPLQALVMTSSETTGSLTSASANKRVACSGGVTLPASGMTAGDFILLDPAGTARTVTRPGSHTMYIYDTDSATGTTRAHNVALAIYHGSSKWTLHGTA